MSCNGCRVLRKGCSEDCTLRAALQGIGAAEAQGHATLFVAKFFGRADLMAFIAAVPRHQRSALFQSLLFEACGRTVNPVNGAVGLLSSGNWHICEAAVRTILSGGVLRPIPPELLARILSSPPNSGEFPTPPSYPKTMGGAFPPSGLTLSPAGTTSFESEVSEGCFENSDNGGGQKGKLLNLFV